MGFQKYINIYMRKRNPNIECSYCKKPIYRTPKIQKESKSGNFFCSNVCRNTFWKDNGTFKGKNNGNYNVRWTGEQKSKGSKTSIERMKDPKMRHLAGSANRGVKFSNERIFKMHGCRLPESYSRPHTEESKKKIGVKSKEKFTKEFKKKFRKTMENSGIWMPESKISNYKFYYKLCEWCDIKEYKDSLGYPLFETFGYYSGKTGNLNGVVRDHIYSRKSGFDNEVFPEILKHPKNLKFISNTENIKKGAKSLYTLEELFDMIINYKGKYKEQKIVLQLINQYHAGQRYDRSNY